MSSPKTQSEAVARLRRSVGKRATLDALDKYCAGPAAAQPPHMVAKTLHELRDELERVKAHADALAAALRDIDTGGNRPVDELRSIANAALAAYEKLIEQSEEQKQ